MRERERERDINKNNHERILTHSQKYQLVLWKRHRSVGSLLVWWWWWWCHGVVKKLPFRIQKMRKNRYKKTPKSALGVSVVSVVSYTQRVSRFTRERERERERKERSYCCCCCCCSVRFFVLYIRERERERLQEERKENYTQKSPGGGLEERLGKRCRKARRRRRTTMT